MQKYEKFNPKVYYLDKIPTTAEIEIKVRANTATEKSKK
jgi:hypothetical protein